MLQTNQLNMADMRSGFDSTSALTKKPSRPGGFAEVRAAPPVAGPEAMRGLVGAWVFAAGLTGVFLIQMLLMGGIGMSDSTPLGVERFTLLAWVLTLGGACVLSVANRSILWQNPRTRWWIAAYAVVFSVMLCRGLLNWETPREGGVVRMLILFVHECLIFLAPLVLIPCGGLLLRSKPFQITVALHAAFGGLLALAVILSNGLSSRTDYLNRDFGINFSGGMPFYAMPLALLLFPRLPKFLAAGVLGGAVGWVVYVVTFQSRISSVLVVCVPCFLIAGVLRERRREGRGSGMFKLGLVVIGLCGIGLLAGRALQNKDLLAGRSCGQRCGEYSVR